jgi:hypothetical protein
MAVFIRVSLNVDRGVWIVAAGDIMAYIVPQIAYTNSTSRVLCLGEELSSW